MSRYKYDGEGLVADSETCLAFDELAEFGFCRAKYSKGRIDDDYSLLTEVWIGLVNDRRAA